MQLVWNVTLCFWANSSDVLKDCGACIFQGQADQLFLDSLTLKMKVVRSL